MSSPDRVWLWPDAPTGAVWNQDGGAGLGAGPVHAVCVKRCGGLWAGSVRVSIRFAARSSHKGRGFFLLLGGRGPWAIGDDGLAGTVEGNGNVAALGDIFGELPLPATQPPHRPKPATQIPPIGPCRRGSAASSASNTGGNKAHNAGNVKKKFLDNLTFFWDDGAGAHRIGHGDAMAADLCG